VCVNTGTIPSKTIREAGAAPFGRPRAGLYGSSYRVKTNTTIADLMQRCNMVIAREIDVHPSQLSGTASCSSARGFVQGSRSVAVKSATGTTSPSAPSSHRHRHGDDPGGPAEHQLDDERLLKQRQRLFMEFLAEDDDGGGGAVGTRVRLDRRPPRQGDNRDQEAS